MPMRLPLLICGLATMVLLPGCGDGPTAPSATAFELTLSPATVPAGATSEGTVTLSERMPLAVHINLSSSDGVASVPSTIVVPSGAKRAAFTVMTRLVAADTVARIMATDGNTRQEFPLQVIAPVARPVTLGELELDAAIVRGGQTAQGTVRLTGAAPAGGLSVSVRSSNSAALVPATVIVQSGALTATFTISTRPVSLDTQLEITAAYSDQTRTVPLRVTP
jgi:hypothetical protein